MASTSAECSTNYRIHSVLKDTNSVMNNNSRSPSRCALATKKGSFLTLLWSFAGFTVLHFVVKIIYNTYVPIEYKYYDAAAAALAGLFVPISGWLADVRYGRYKVTKYSLWSIWIIIIAVSGGHILNQLDYITTTSASVIFSILILALLLGLSGFQANLLQLGIDQVNDSSSHEVVSYIILYVWTFSASEVLIQFTQICYCKPYGSVSNFISCVVLTVAVCSDCLFSHWLVKESVRSNPLKLIFDVLRYAMMNKYPRLRSAYVFWDDKRYSRIDFAKVKFGGPFPAGQVEDVKTFFRMSVVIGILSVFTGLLFQGSNAISKINIHLNVSNNFCSNSLCFERLAVGNAGELFVTVSLPLYVCLVFPQLRKCLAKISILKKCGMSMCVLFIGLLCFLSIQTVLDTGAVSNANSTCILDDNRAVPLNLWLIGPSILAGIGESLLLISCIEFVSAQSPYFMRSMLFGLVYVGFACSLFFLYILRLLFSRHIQWDKGLRECGFWFLAVCTMTSSLFIVAFLVASRWYKSRERIDDLPAEPYYDSHSDYQEIN